MSKSTKGERLAHLGGSFPRVPLMLAQGVPARVVMDVLGHSQIALTMNTYTHVLPELKHEAARRMNDLMLER